MTKWFFALSEASMDHPNHDWKAMIRAAVLSAKANTGLQAHFLYDGAPSAFIESLQGLGVTVLHRALTFLPNIQGRWHQIGLPPDALRLSIMAGAYLRTEIPSLDLADEYILYTDCDVLFLADPEIERFRPAYFACAPQRDPNDLADINSGVMVMNVPAMRQELANFWHFIVNNFERFGAHDQDALREYYAGRYDTLPLEMNWKPYWGTNPAARIVHFHGPKPGVVRHLLTDPAYPVPAIWRELFDEHPGAYAEYLRRWDEAGGASAESQAA